MKNPTKITLILGLLGGTVAAQAQTVYSNNFGGDNFTNPGASPANQMVNGVQGGGPEQVTYRETKNNGTVGINMNLPRSGNGSVWFSTNGTAGGKSEIALSTGFSGAGDSTGILGAFDNLSALGADLYTLASPDSGNQAPILRIELFSAVENKYGQLVFDTGWTPGHYGTFTYGQWNTVDLLSNANSIWLRATSGINAAYDPGAGPDNHERTLANWQSILGGKGYQVISVNSGMGTFNGTYQGAMDNLSVGFGGDNHVYNFEAVPEPASLCALGLGALALIRKRKASK